MAEERGVLEEIGTFLAAQPHAYFFQMATAVVAGDAGSIDSQKSLGIENGELVIGVQLLHHAEVIAIFGMRLPLYMLARDHIDSGHDMVTLG